MQFTCSLIFGQNLFWTLLYVLTLFQHPRDGELKVDLLQCSLLTTTLAVKQFLEIVVCQSFWLLYSSQHHLLTQNMIVLNMYIIAATPDKAAWSQRAIAVLSWKCKLRCYPSNSLPHPFHLSLPLHVSLKVKDPAVNQTSIKYIHMYHCPSCMS